MKKIVLLISILIISCSEEDKSCETFLECLDGTYWSSENNLSAWRFFNDKNGVYMDVHINNGGCYLYEDNNMVGAAFKFQTKENLSEEYAGSNWLYTIVNDSLIEKTMAAGGNTYYFIKRDKAHFNQILDLGSCN